MTRYLSRRLTLLPILVLIHSITCSQSAFSASYRVGIAPSLPEPVLEEMEDVEEESLETRMRRGLKVKKEDAEIPIKAEVSKTQPKDLPSKYEAWRDALLYLGKKIGIELTLVKASSQLKFELGLSKGIYDFAYVTPLQFTAFNEQPGYKAIAKRKAQPLRGVIYVKNTSQYQSLVELKGETFVFPNPLDFAGSVAIRSSLDKLDYDFETKFMPNHAQTYAQVAIGNFVAGGGTRETFLAQPPEIRKNLRIIWDSPGYSPYPFVAHPRVPFYTITRLQREMVNMSKDPNMEETLKYLFVNNGFEVARDKDWHEITLIDLNKLNGYPQKISAPEPEAGQ